MRKFIKKGVGLIAAIAFSFSFFGCNDKTATTEPVSQTEKTAWDQLALTPPMGWNSWNAFGKEVSEQVIKETADAIVSTGLKE